MQPSISGGRLKAPQYKDVFCDHVMPLTEMQAQVESSRCYYCYDAPCIQACPTQIDIPSFIRKINNGNIKGAAIDILSANIMGGTCSRACPVETLCQEACVREHAEKKPVQIGSLQRFATDEFFKQLDSEGKNKKTGEKPFTRAKSTGKKVAVVGAGPAGMSCAHRLAMLGHSVTVYEAREKAGGLNEYGLAPYKMTDDFAQKELDFILSIGGIEVKTGKRLGQDIQLDGLKKDYDAVFLGLGLGSTNRLGIEGEDLPGVIDAVAKISEIRQAQAKDPSGSALAKVPVGRNVVVIGGGNTAVDIAIQIKRLGAEFVTLVYRRGQEDMSATHHEQELAQKNGVVLKTWAKPSRILGDSKGVTEVQFEYTAISGGKLSGIGEFFSLKADQVFKAIGQKLEFSGLDVDGGKIVVNDQFETKMAGIFAGGDCVGPGEDLTVTAVQQGKLAAMAIDQKLAKSQGGKRG
ncbi:MAG: NAD(P)-dependent oxidoreductase [Bdellovibrionales bacterium]|nr:NAD(P)-dependent oxidoreductase [Bdellovibrionales bacterium]